MTFAIRAAPPMSVTSLPMNSCSLASSMPSSPLQRPLSCAACGGSVAETPPQENLIRLAGLLRACREERGLGQACKTALAFFLANLSWPSGKSFWHNTGATLVAGATNVTRDGGFVLSRPPYHGGAAPVTLWRRGERLGMPRTPYNSLNTQLEEKP